MHPIPSYSITPHPEPLYFAKLATTINEQSRVGLSFNQSIKSSIISSLSLCASSSSSSSSSSSPALPLCCSSSSSSSSSSSCSSRSSSSSAPPRPFPFCLPRPIFPIFPLARCTASANDISFPLSFFPFFFFFFSSFILSMCVSLPLPLPLSLGFASAFRPLPGLVFRPRWRWTGEGALVPV
ncbi:hypothetical protein BDR22DRAFT_831032 [Usnea florida]